MAQTQPSSPLAPVPVDVVEAMVLANGWAGKAHLDRLRPTIKDGRMLMKMLVEQNIAPPESLAQFDLLLHLQQQLKNYTILKKLGAGGMGTVYLAKHHDTNQEVALKVISARLAGDSEFLGRFHRETQALIGLRHPFLANIIESGTTGQTHFLAMEPINGPSLASMLKEFRALPEEYVLHLMLQVCDCLHYVTTTAGLIHRDVKPENILIARNPAATDMFPADDEAKLIDFGLVKSANDDEHLTQTGMTIGTPLYMSPEQVRGDKLDARSDIYGVGATMFHLLTGSPPFKGTSPGAIMSAHLTDPTPDPGDLVPSLTPETRRICMTAMAKDSKDRYLTFEAMIRACEIATSVVNERSGGAIKLLRKPLIIAKKMSAKPVNSNPGTGSRPANSTGATAPIVLPDISQLHKSESSKVRSIGARISQKNADRKRSDRLTATGAEKKPASHHAVSPTPNVGTSTHSPSDAVNDSSATSATEALLKAHTERATRKPRLPKTPEVEPDLTKSAAFVEDSSPNGSTGILPWVFLILALLLAGAIFYVRMSTVA